MISSNLSRLHSTTHHTPKLLPPPSSLLHTRLPPPKKPLPARSPPHHPLLSLLGRRHAPRQLKQIHAHILLSGLLSDPSAAARLILSASPDLPYCRSILAHLHSPATSSWNAAIRAHSDADDPQECLLLYGRMLRSGARPDNYTFPFVLKACARIPGLRAGGGMFAHVLRLGLDSDVFVVNAAIHVLAVCGGLQHARRLFDGSRVRDLVSWNTMINGYVRSGRPREALEVFREMEAEEVTPDEVTMIGVVSCCTQLRDLESGRRFHRCVVEKGLEFTVPLTNVLMDMYVKCGSLELAELLFNGMAKRTVVSWTTMVVGYAKFGLLDAAQKVFDRMPERDVVPWNALIAGYVQCKQGKEALALFHEMQASHVEPNEVTMVSLLSACAQLGALEMGLWIHSYIEKQKFRCSVVLGTALVDMYAKCGNIEKSATVFKEIPERNALTWTAMICGLASHGHAKAALDHFSEMLEIGLEPDEVTFLGILSACCHGGMVKEGRMYFKQMRLKFKLLPKVKHYSCMVDLFGRAGLVYEAEELIKTMPMEPDAVVWGALFFACRIHGHVSMGKHAAVRLLELDPRDSGIYVLLANMYAESNMRDEADRVRILMRKRGVEKTPGCSLIELNGLVSEFIIRDKSHPQSKEIYACLMQLARQMAHHGITSNDSLFNYA